MMERNVSVKPHPERWQDAANPAAFDIIFCLEERVYDLVVDGRQTDRDPGRCHIHASRNRPDAKAVAEGV